MKQRFYSEFDCLQLIKAGEYDASDLLREHCPAAVRKFKRIDKALVDLLKEVREVFPEAAYYTASGGLNLLLGMPHTPTGRPQSQLVALSGNASITRPRGGGPTARRSDPHLAFPLRVDRVNLMMFLEMDEVSRRTTICRSKLYDLVRQGSFPSPAKIGKRSVWVEDEVVKWQTERLAAR